METREDTVRQVRANVKRIMSVRSINNTQLGAKWGKRTAQSVGQKISGKREMTLSDILELSEILDVPTEFLFFDFSGQKNADFQRFMKTLSLFKSVKPSVRTLAIRFGIKSFHDFQKISQTQKEDRLKQVVAAQK